MPEQKKQEELTALKNWFLEEQARLKEARDEVEKMKEELSQEKSHFWEETERTQKQIQSEKKRLAQENNFFDQKMKILKSGFEQLEDDRRKFEKERDKFNAKRAVYDEEQAHFQYSEMKGMLFRGVNSFLALKKRYRDLIKMFHPDNVAGDHEMIQIINREYEELKKAYEIEKQA